MTCVVRKRQILYKSEKFKLMLYWTNLENITTFHKPNSSNTKTQSYVTRYLSNIFRHNDIIYDTSILMKKKSTVLLILL